MSVQTVIVGVAMLATWTGGSDESIGLEEKLGGAPPSPNIHLGNSVALEGDVLVVGVGNDGGVGTGGGSVLVFRRQQSQWIQEERLIGSQAITGAGGFGESLDIHEGTIIVGAPGSRDAYIFVHDGTEWQEEAFLTSGASGFGRDVAIHNDTAVVSITPTGDWAVGEVFERVGSTWSSADYLYPVSPASSSRRALDIEGGVIAVAVWQGGPGSVLFFEKQGATGWGEVASLGGVQVGSLASLEIAPGVMAVSDGSLQQVQMFHGGGTSWTPAGVLQPADVQGSDDYGRSLALTASTLVVGARYDDDEGSNSGSAYIYDRVGSSWQERMKLVAHDDQALDNFGTAVAVDSDRIVVGSPKDDDGGQDTGSVYIYRRFPGFSAFCHGDGGDQMGCTNCPCGNNAPVGTEGGCTNSAGSSAILSATGVPSASADSLRFALAGGPPTAFSLLMSGRDRLPNGMANPCFGLDSGIVTPVAPRNGLRCIGNLGGRHGNRAIAMDGTVGNATPAWGGDDPPHEGLIAQGGHAVGQTRHFQVIYRDYPDVHCMTGLNTSNGLSATFVP